MRKFRLIQEIIKQYTVYLDNIYNFYKIGFQIGVISLINVFTSLECYIKPTLIQLGNYKQDIAIQSIYATRYATLLFIFYKGRVYISTQYKEVDILYKQKILVSKTSQTNNALSLKQLKHFNTCIKTRQVGLYRLLILDSYKSYLNQDFKEYYLRQKILILYILSYSLYIL